MTVRVALVESLLRIDLPADPHDQEAGMAFLEVVALSSMGRDVHRRVYADRRGP